MVLSAALHWWEEWQLRILVLSSLLVHGFLFFSSWIRKFHALRKLRAVVWIAYIGSDAIAIYALATLFNRHKEMTPNGVPMSSSLEIIWAPVLLIHLGGHPSISAFSIEDNELWKRHVVTLVCQVMVALYVFCKWSSGEERQLKAAVLLFIVGILKFGRKPWALWSASFNCMTASADAALPKSIFSCGVLCTASCLRLLSATLERGGTEGGEETNISLQEYVEKAKKYYTQEDQDATNDIELRKFAGIYDYVCRMFVDMSAPYFVRLQYLRGFLKLDREADDEAHLFFRKLLDTVFHLLYTDISSSVSGLGLCSYLLLPSLVITSLVLFAKSHKDGYKKADITVTYILFSSNVAQELLPFLINPIIVVASHRLTSCHSMVSQCNLMSLCVCKKNPTIPMKLVPVKCLSDYINKHCYIEQVPEALMITQLLTRHVKDGWKEYISDAAGYRRFNNFRGQQALRRHPELQWILNVPFDESVLLWHVATDLCFHCNNSPDGQRHAGGSRLISNYMAYLLFKRPEMLMPGTRSGLFNIASHELALIMREDSKLAQVDSEQMLVREIMRSNEEATAHVPTQGMGTSIEELESPAPTNAKGACDLAKSLMGLREKKRWRVIQGMWVEMLCFSASRCRGYLHAKSLGQGGEYLTTVWLLWSYMGMETLTYMIQSLELTKEEVEEEDDDDDADDDDDDPTESTQENSSAC